MLRPTLLSALATLAALAGVVLLPTNAYALTVSRAELINGDLRIDGANAAPGIFVIAESTTSAAGIRSDTSGAYHISGTDFRADDCTVVVSDRRTFVSTVTLSGCTPTPATPPADTPPSGDCVISPAAAGTMTVGDLQAYFFHTTGCDTTKGPVGWEFVAGRVPPGVTGPSLQGQDGGAVTGRPTTEGSYDFMVRVTDSAGQTDTETFHLSVVAPRPLAVTNPSLDPGSVGRSYLTYLKADGGLPGYLWTLRSGTLPAGLRLTSAGAIAGTPTAAGTSSFTVRVTDSRGTTTDRTFSLTVS